MYRRPVKIHNNSAGVESAVKRTEKEKRGNKNGGKKENGKI